MKVVPSLFSFHLLFHFMCFHFSCAPVLLLSGFEDRAARYTNRHQMRSSCPDCRGRRLMDNSSLVCGFISTASPRVVPVLVAMCSSYYPPRLNLAFPRVRPVKKIQNQSCPSTYDISAFNKTPLTHALKHRRIPHGIYVL